MTEKVKLSKTKLDAIKPDSSKRRIVWDTGIQGFAVRVLPSGAKTLFYQGRVNGELIRVTIGRYTGNAASSEQARKKAQQIAAAAAMGTDPRDKARDKGASTFGALLTAYCDMLEADGKESARAVRLAVERNIKQPFPKLWKKPAASIDIDDCIKVIGRLHDDDKPRQADKLRSYIKAAFTRAINARGNVKAPQVLRDMRLSFNPARDIQKVDGSSNASERALSLAEFRAYWRHVKALPEPRRSLAMLHLLTGGQRMKQLSRVTESDIDRDAMLMIVRDGKGRRARERVYGVPLLPQALQCIDNITGSGEYVFSANGGKTAMGTSYLSDIASDVCNRMAEAGELEGPPFTGKVIRATIETRLMGKPYRVSSDVLKRLLSHGMGGIQEKHYAHDSFHEEQLEALQKLWRMLEDEPEPDARIVKFPTAGAV